MFLSFHTRVHTIHTRFCHSSPLSALRDAAFSSSGQLRERLVRPRGWIDSDARPQPRYNGPDVSRQRRPHVQRCRAVARMGHAHPAGVEQHPAAAEPARRRAQRRSHRWRPSRVVEVVVRDRCPEQQGVNTDLVLPASVKIDRGKGEAVGGGVGMQVHHAAGGLAVRRHRHPPAGGPARRRLPTNRCLDCHTAAVPRPALPHRRRPRAILREPRQAGQQHDVCLARRPAAEGRPQMRLRPRGLGYQ
eukprot:scaffold4193_cov110-Isochrysis_galbana.AAC.2